VNVSCKLVALKNYTYLQKGLENESENIFFIFTLCTVMLKNEDQALLLLELVKNCRVLFTEQYYLNIFSCVKLKRTKISTHFWNFHSFTNIKTIQT
jgi:hypothetical protein